MKVLGTRVVIEPERVESKSATGIVLAVTEAKVSNRGTVKFVGSKVSEVEVGDKVIFSKTYIPIEDNGVELFLMDVENVEVKLCKV
jgi:co-chaperonin GroES (HSP10)